MKPSLLIVNADDFGLTEGNNRAIIDAHRNGIVTSTSLLANGYAFDHAVQLAQQAPALGIGVHLTLTEGYPLTQAKDLIGADGKLPLSNQPFARKLITAQLPRAAIRAEFTAQIQKVISAGITPTHLDGHKYIHLLPGITELVIGLAQEFKIGVVRLPVRVVGSLDRKGRLAGLAALQGMGLAAKLQAKNIRHGDRFVGFVETGHLSVPVLERYLLPAKPGITDVVCHPAYYTSALDDLLAQGYEWIAGYDFAGETAAVCDTGLRERLIAAGWGLRNWGSKI